jgi:hypothetical protein
MLSGNHDLIVAALDTLREYELVVNDEAYTSAIFGLCSEALKLFLGQIKAVKDA